MKYEVWDSVCSWHLKLSVSGTRVRITELWAGEMAQPIVIFVYDLTNKACLKITKRTS